MLTTEYTEYTEEMESDYKPLSTNQQLITNNLEPMLYSMKVDLRGVQKLKLSAV